jgi:hypothetical protein
MNTIADMAVQNSITFEAKKDSLRQVQSGDWKISFTVQGADMDERLTKAAMGTRFVAVLVGIDDSELPVTHAAREANLVPGNPADKPKREWRDMQPAQQAGIRCAEPVFVTFLKENYPEDFRALEGNPAELVRFICGVSSRAKLNTVQASRAIWHQLDEEFQAWKARENA